MYRQFLIIIFLITTLTSLRGQDNQQQNTNRGDQHNGTYRNPVLPADYSDPDCIRVRDDYYAISSTMQFSPGMVVLHSKDLVNWEIISHVVDDLRRGQRFPTHTLLWFLFSQTSIIYFIRFMINTVLWALVVERILWLAKTKLFGLLLFIFLAPPDTFAQLNPTGTYKMSTGPDDNYNVTNKSRGEIRIKKINNTKIAIALYAIIGYDVADLVDTLTFKNGKAVYQGNRSDSTCRIYFEFSKSKVMVKQTSNEHPSPCGFGWNADASGTYRKQSARVPIITDLAKEE